VPTILNRPRRMRFRHCFGIAVLVIFLAGSPAGATENGLAHYPTGTNTIVPALVPPPGESVLLNYVTFYTADRVNNSKGDSAVPGYRLNALADAARLLHTWTAFDGVSWTTGVVLIASYAEVHVPNRSASGGGFGDLVIQPLLLTAAFGDLHVLGGFDVTFPTGHFSKRELVNPGFNYPTYALQGALTWLPTKELELSLFSTAGFNMKNPATHYTSGSYVDFDYSVGYRPIPSLPAFQASVVGYLFEQVTDDKLNGHLFLDGHRGQAFAIGPQVRYQLGRGGNTLKWQHEMAVKNRPVGDRFQVQFAVPF
jgi:hypothetical protein